MGGAPMMSLGIGLGSGWSWPVYLLALVLLVAAVVKLLHREPAGSRHRRVGEDRAIAILRERHAHGEIDEREFEEQMRRLKGG